MTGPATRRSSRTSVFGPADASRGDEVPSRSHASRGPAAAGCAARSTCSFGRAITRPTTTAATGTGSLGIRGAAAGSLGSLDVKEQGPRARGREAHEDRETREPDPPRKEAGPAGASPKPRRRRSRRGLEVASSLRALSSRRPRRRRYLSVLPRRRGNPAPAPSHSL